MSPSPDVWRRECDASIERSARRRQAAARPRFTDLPVAAVVLLVVIVVGLACCVVALAAMYALTMIFAGA